LIADRHNRVRARIRGGLGRGRPSRASLGDQGATAITRHFVARCLSEGLRCRIRTIGRKKSGSAIRGVQNGNHPKTKKNNPPKHPPPPPPHHKTKTPPPPPRTHPKKAPHPPKKPNQTHNKKTTKNPQHPKLNPPPSTTQKKTTTTPGVGNPHRQSTRKGEI